MLISHGQLEIQGCGVGGTERSRDGRAPFRRPISWNLVIAAVGQLLSGRRAGICCIGWAAWLSPRRDALVCAGIASILNVSAPPKFDCRPTSRGKAR